MDEIHRKLTAKFPFPYSYYLRTDFKLRSYEYPLSDNQLLQTS